MSEKRVLMLGHLAYIIMQFNIPNIKLLIKMGYKVDVACNLKLEYNDLLTEEKIENFKKELEELGCNYYQIDFHRNPLHAKMNLKAYRQVCDLLNKKRYQFIHCHSPIGGVAGRIAGHKTKTKVIYTAHGFHFYKGAPLKNWMVFYPIEKYCSKYTEVILTINKEDYEIACKEFHSKRVEYIPGVGVEINKYQCPTIAKDEMREKLSLPQKSFVLLSVGEVNENKNHEVIIRALSQLADEDIHYCIAGQGNKMEQLRVLAKKLEMSERVHFLGYRNDICELNHMADVFCFPSKREGLGLAAIEAMAAGIPLVTSKSGGIKDYSLDGYTGYSCDYNNDNQFADAIKKIKKDLSINKDKYCKICKKQAMKFDISNVEMIVRNVYLTMDE